MSHQPNLKYRCSYYDQLCELEAKIPAGELQVAFKWRDAFDKGSIFGGKMSLSEYIFNFHLIDAHGYNLQWIVFGQCVYGCMDIYSNKVFTLDIASVVVLWFL